ncbi:MAG: alcohol dehydrogenase catalytic domain-containing protein [Acidobacteria bacterium]|nr:alcohol dehydrogenase catalytic domain-containing protein [Acidobacteriota bacterium]
MTAAVLYGKEELRVEQVPVPQLSSEDVLVRVKAALTCGTDLKVYRQGYHARMIVPPAIFGHELAGVVAEVGEEVRQFRKGMRVVAANSAPCLQCRYCRRDRANLCKDLLFNNGAYAEYIRIPGRIVRQNLLEIPDHIDFADAALVEPLACVLRGLEETGLRSGDTMAIIGIGPIGLLFVRLAKLRGARVIAIGKRPSQLLAAKRMGADEVVCTGETPDVITEVRRWTPDGEGVDVAIEAVGTPLTWEWAAAMVHRGGTVNFFGGCPSGSSVQLDTARLHYSEITIKASFHHTPAYIRKALECISRGDIQGNDVITGQAPLARLPDVLAHMLNRNGDLKTAIVP